MAAPERKPRPYIGVHFKCCHVYYRIYLNRSGNAYEGGCPKCGARIRVRVAPGGSKSRFWTAD